MQSLLAEMETAMLKACAGSINIDNSHNLSVVAVQYHLRTRGHQLRARLCLDASIRLGIPGATAVILASICELLHNASLIHDDLIDRSTMRRNQEAVWLRFGDGIAVCAGDLLLGAAYSTIPGIAPASLISEISALVHMRLQQVIWGQAEELRSSANSTVYEYERLATGKSASLLGLCLELPLTVANLRVDLPLAQQVAASFAVAYQIADDLRDAEEDHLSNRLNFVQVLSSKHGVSVAEARFSAELRVKSLLIETELLAAKLPFQCGAVLMEHAALLQEQLQDHSSIAVARA